MKLPRTRLRDRRIQGFTLLELLVVMAIIALLAALTVGAFGYAQQAAARNRTNGALAAIRSGLEQYKERFGEYPESTGSRTGTFSGGTYRVDGALMLYQALTGDGTNYIKLPVAGDTSDGTVTADEARESINLALPKQVIMKTSEGWMLVDGFSRPFQYDKAALETAVPTTINPTYDLYSFGNATVSPGTVSLELKKSSDPAKNGSWIKNW